MKGKILAVIISAVLVAGSSGAQKAVRCVAGNRSVLYLTAEYKLMIGDQQTALRIFRQLASSAPAPAKTPASTNACELQPPATSDCAAQPKSACRLPLGS